MSINDGSASFEWNTVQGHNIDCAGAWYIDWTLLPPCAPLVKSIDSKPNMSLQERLGRTSIVQVDKRPDGVRATTPKRIALAWPRIDIRFWQFLRYKYVFGLPVVLNVPVLTPVDSETMVTPPDRDDLYLSTYFAKERWWRAPLEGEVTAKVYKNDNQQVSGFTIDYEEGTVTFDSPLAKTDVVKALYVYCAPFIVVSLTPNFLPGTADLQVAPEIILEEIAALPDRA